MRNCLSTVEERTLTLPRTKCFSDLLLSLFFSILWNLILMDTPVPLPSNLPVGFISRYPQLTLLTAALLMTLPLPVLSSCTWCFGLTHRTHHLRLYLPLNYCCWSSLLSALVILPTHPSVAGSLLCCSISLIIMGKTPSSTDILQFFFSPINFTKHSHRQWFNPLMGLPSELWCVIPLFPHLPLHLFITQFWHFPSSQLCFICLLIYCFLNNPHHMRVLQKVHENEIQK